MKKLWMIAYLVILATCSYAQSKMTEKEKEEAIARYRSYIESLHLTGEQRPQVEEINMRFFTGISNVKKSNASKLEKYRTFKSLSSARDSEMKKVLTKDQYAIYKENQEEQRENFRQQRRQNP